MTTIKLRSSLAAAFYALLLTGTWRCAVVVGMPMIIRNDAVQLMDGVAVLGRGYSTTTNSFQGTCLEVNGTLVNKSYNYECKFPRLNLNLNLVDSRILLDFIHSIRLSRFDSIRMIRLIFTFCTVL